MNETKETLQTILINMDIPESKLNLDDISNIRWLQRNISIRNSNHPLFTMACDLIKELLKNA